MIMVSSPWTLPQCRGFVIVATALFLFLIGSNSALIAAQEGNDCPAGSSSSSADGTCRNVDNANANANNVNIDIDIDTVDCGVYMAPSTVGDHSNLGIYTAKAMKDGDKVPYPEIIIPLLWRIFGVHPVDSLTDGSLWDRYIWEQYVGGIEVFEDLDRPKERAACFIPGVGCTVNSMLELGNIDSAQGSEFDEVVPRNSPGAGAFTPYHSSPTIVASPDGFDNENSGVDAGQELFATYGDEWIPWIPNVAVTRHANFKKADELMGVFEDWIVEREGGEENDTTSNNGSGKSESEITDELLEDMWKLMLDFPHVGPRQWEELSVLPKEWSRDRLKELKHVKQQQKQNQQLLKNKNKDEPPAKGEESSSPLLLPLPNPPSTSTRYWAERGKVSLEFLRQEGKCQDHIRPDISTIPHAGRGAFASRDLPKGTVVGYSPLVHVAVRGEQLFEVTYNGESQHGMERFEFRDVDEDDIDDEDEDKDDEETLDEKTAAAANRTNRYTKPDLVVNYSFGHRNSTLHLTPYGAMVNYINHKSSSATNDEDVDGPNVRVQWPTREFVAHKPEWLSKDINFLRDSIDKIGLSFDYVALRDIKEGEEVTMDYGDEWDKAWKEHVANWVPPEDAAGYVHSSKFETEYLRTPEELENESESYPWNLHTLCTDFYTKSPNEDDSSYAYVSPLKSKDQTHLLPCRVLERVSTKDDNDGDEIDDDDDESSYVYTVELQLSDDDVVVAKGYPRDDDGVQLYDKAYSPMWHMKEAFRHKMYIPDDIFPENWMTTNQE